MKEKLVSQALLFSPDAFEDLLFSTLLVKRVGFDNLNIRACWSVTFNTLLRNSIKTWRQTNNRFSLIFSKWRLMRTTPFLHISISIYTYFYSHFKVVIWLSQIKIPWATSRILLYLFLFVFVFPIRFSLFPTSAPNVCFCCWFCFHHIDSQERLSQKQNKKIFPHKCSANIFFCAQFRLRLTNRDSRSIRNTCLLLWISYLQLLLHFTWSKSFRVAAAIQSIE